MHNLTHLVRTSDHDPGVQPIVYRLRPVMQANSDESVCCLLSLKQEKTCTQGSQEYMGQNSLRRRPDGFPVIAEGFRRFLLVCLAIGR